MTEQEIKYYSILFYSQKHFENTDLFESGKEIIIHLKETNYQKCSYGTAEEKSSVRNSRKYGPCERI